MPEFNLARDMLNRKLILQTGISDSNSAILDNPDNSEIITMPKSAKELEDAIERVYLKRYHAPNLTRPLRQRNSHI